MQANIDTQAISIWLDHGDIKRLAADYMITERQAHNILKGKSKNYRFLELLIQQAERNMNLAKRTEELRKNLNLLQK